MVKDVRIELSIQEQMYIYTKNYKKMFPQLITILVAMLLFSLVIFQQMGEVMLSDPLSESMMLYSGVISIISAYGILWFVIKGKKDILGIKNIMTKYTNNSYFIALGLTAHKNDKNIPDDFYEMCLSVFPELKEADNESLKETGKVLELEELTLEVEDEDYSLTIANISNKKFIIKYFKKTEVDYDQLKEYVKIVNKEFGTNIFRVVCLAKKFDSKILKKYETLPYQGIPLDLIIVTDNGFSGLKISETLVQ